jgi:hypothetical protein
MQCPMKMSGLRYLKYVPPPPEVGLGREGRFRRSSYALRAPTCGRSA